LPVGGKRQALEENPAGERGSGAESSIQHCSGGLKKYPSKSKNDLATFAEGYVEGHEMTIRQKLRHRTGRPCNGGKGGRLFLLEKSYRRRLEGGAGGVHGGRKKQSIPAVDIARLQGRGGDGRVLEGRVKKKKSSIWQKRPV